MFGWKKKERDMRNRYEHYHGTDTKLASIWDREEGYAMLHWNLATALMLTNGYVFLPGANASTSIAYGYANRNPDGR